MKKLIFSLFITFFLISCNSAKFSIHEKKIIKKYYVNKIMPLKVVSNKQDSVLLHLKSKYFKVSLKDKKLKRLVDLMYNTCIDSTNPGVGIAAPQVGVNKRVIWVQRFDKKKNPFEVYFNAEVLKLSSSKSDGWEGCLSVPGYSGIVKRSDTIIIKYDIFKRKNYIDTISGFSAVIFQHEIDHLDGILYTDRIFDKSNLYSEEEYKKLFNKDSD